MRAFSLGIVLLSNSSNSEFFVKNVLESASKYFFTHKVTGARDFLIPSIIIEYSLNSSGALCVLLLSMI